MTAAEAAPDPTPSRAGGLLRVVRALIDYGRRLAIAFRSNPNPFGAGDIALILARITQGLLRAEALEARIIRNAARLDAPPAPTPRGTPHRKLPAARAAIAPPTDTTREAWLPTPEQIAAEVRRRSIGAVIADICRDLGVTPNHPLWRELRVVIIRHGGSLARLVNDIVKDICERTFQRPASLWPLIPPLPPPPRSPAPSGTGPP